MMTSGHYMKHKMHDIEAGKRRSAPPELCKEYMQLLAERKKAEERTKPAKTPDKDKNQFTLFGERVSMREVRRSRRYRGYF